MQAAHSVSRRSNGVSVYAKGATFTLAWGSALRIRGTPNNVNALKERFHSV